MADTINLLVDGGKASAGPPLGPALGPTGINIMNVVNEINKATKAFDGMKVPVAVVIDAKTKTFKIEVGTPPASALIKSVLGIETAAHNPKTEKVGDLTIEQVVQIVGMKGADLAGKTIKDRASEVMGTCVSMGVTVEGKDPRDVQKELRAGAYDDRLEA